MSVIGLDLGTSRVKAVRFDSTWRAVDTEAETTIVQRSPAGECEQDMAAVWAAAARVIHAVAARSPDGVDLLALTAQGDGCWLVDAHGEPLRPAILWNDNRGSAIIDQWDRDGRLEQAFRINGCWGAPGLAHAQLRWLDHHQPHTLAGASRLLSCGSWIYQQLTGRQVLEVSDAANPFLAARTRTYDPTLLDLFELVQYRRLLPELVSGPDRVAPLLGHRAHDLGLPVGTPVALAPYDVVATALGTGTLHAGEAFAVLGTTLCVGMMAADPALNRTPNGMTLPGPTTDSWLLAYATLNGTEVLDWTAATLGLADVTELLSLAATAQPGGQPLMLPYLSPAGERSPFRDSTAQGSLHGLTSRHSRADIARAALDALTLAVRACLEAAGRPQGLALAGGGARSELWSQAISDATGLPVTGPDTPEVGARGAVLTAAVDADMINSLDDAAAVAIRPGRTYTPNRDETERFSMLYHNFQAVRALSTR